MNPVEERAGEGELSRQGDFVRRVRYRLSRFQGALPGSGLPLPGAHRLEGTIDRDSAAAVAHLVGVRLTLRLEDGRAFGVTLMDASGRIHADGRMPAGCSCC
jgi:hypothetical protein